MDYNNIFIISFYIFAVIGILIKLFLNNLNIRHIAAHENTVPKEFSDKISLDDHKKSAEYSIARLRFGSISSIISFLFLLVWLPLGGLKYIDQISRNFGYSEITTGLIFFGLFSLVGIFIDLPESIYKTFILEERFGFNKTTPKLFVKDLLKQLLLSIVIGAPLLFVLLTIMSKLGNNWWAYAWVFIVIFQFFIIWAYPKFIAPLFNKFSKMNDEDLKTEIDNLIGRCDLNFKEYYVMDASIRSSHGNAYFTGFGKNKRIVFFDTLLKSLNQKEVVAVLAHELGHLKHKHILKSLFWGIIFMGIGFYILGQLYKSPTFFTELAGVESSSYMGLILFTYVSSIFTFIFTPISSWLSRKNEYQADEFAANHASGQALIDALIGMYKDNSNTLTPSPTYSKFYYSHPPALERVKFIKTKIV